MSTNDVLDVLNIQREDLKTPAKKKQRLAQDAAPRQTGMARELYNLLGPNTPPVALSSSSYSATRDKIKSRPSPWTKMSFQPRPGALTLQHWVKGSKELLQSEEELAKPYAFAKYSVQIETPELVLQDEYDTYMTEIYQNEREALKKNKEREHQKLAAASQDQVASNQDKVAAISGESSSEQESGPLEKKSPSGSTADAAETTPDKGNTTSGVPSSGGTSGDKTEPIKVYEESEGESSKDDEDLEDEINKWSYEETKYLFDMCKGFELKWCLIHDRYKYNHLRTLDDLKEHFYRICVKILESQDNANPALVDSLRAYSKTRELERKNYLENLLKRTPAEIAEEESLVIEARRFELAAKKMLMERSHLLTLLDSPQTTLSVQKYLSSLGLTNLYNNLMILDKNQKKRQHPLYKENSAANTDPVPPTIPVAASSSFKKDRSFQTHLQQYLSSYLKQNQNVTPAIKQEANSIQQLLAKKLTQKEEEAYGLHFHGTERLNAGVILRSGQRLPGLQQKQSTLKSVTSLFQELDIPTAGGTSWRPVMPTRKTMAKYDELLRSVVALLEIKKGRDKLEAEIRLIKSQRGLQ